MPAIITLAHTLSANTRRASFAWPNTFVISAATTIILPSPRACESRQRGWRRFSRGAFGRRALFSEAAVHIDDAMAQNRSRASPARRRRH